MSQERRLVAQNHRHSLISNAEQKVVSLFGQTAGNAFVDKLRSNVSKFDLEISGQRHLQNLQNQPYLLVANHIKTKGILIGQRDLNITPDAFILERTVKDLTGIKPQIVASSDFGFLWHENPAAVKIQRKVEDLRDHLLTGAGFIPIKRGDGKVNLKFFRQVRSTLAANTPIIIFPEGNSYWAHEQETPLKDGVALLAQKNKVPIIPVRIEGATTWSPKLPISVSFREPVSPHHSTGEIMRYVKCGIS